MLLGTLWNMVWFVYIYILYINIFFIVAFLVLTLKVVTFSIHEDVVDQNDTENACPKMNITKQKYKPYILLKQYFFLKKGYQIRKRWSVIILTYTKCIKQYE